MSGNAPSWAVWIPVFVSVVSTIGAIYAALSNRRGQSEKVQTDADGLFRKDLLDRVARLEQRVEDLQKELYDERIKGVEKERDYNALLLEHEDLKREYEALIREAEELRPLKDEVETLRTELQKCKGGTGP